MPESTITKRALAEALKRLLETTPLEKISVGQICRACGMNRKSFYYHFHDKYELVRWISSTELDGFLSSRQATGDAVSDWELIRDVCAYLDKNRPFYRAALAYSGQNSLSGYLMSAATALAERRVGEILPDLAQGRERYASFIVTFYADALVASIRRWVFDDEPLPLDEFIGLLKASLTVIPKRSSEKPALHDVGASIRLMHSERD